MHGSAACPRAIYEGGAQGWDPNEAAALSMLLDYNGFPYDYFVNDQKIEPPPFRFVICLISDHGRSDSVRCPFYKCGCQSRSVMVRHCIPY